MLPAARVSVPGSVQRAFIAKGPPLKGRRNFAPLAPVITAAGPVGGGGGVGGFNNGAVGYVRCGAKGAQVGFYNAGRRLGGRQCLAFFVRGAARGYRQCVRVLGAPRRRRKPRKAKPLQLILLCPLCVLVSC